MNTLLNKMLSKETSNYLRSVFQHIVQSVKPRELLKSELKLNGTTLTIRSKDYQIYNNCYVVGFGKAVYDMGCEVSQLLGSHVQKGILSVPEGSVTPVGCYALEKKGYNIFQGARNNYPDENSYKATREIVTLVETLSENDLLLVLISGGGSALLTSPLFPITIDDKMEITKLLSGSGADIKEMNTVRKQLSAVKGGNLARIAYPCQAVSLILSDVIGDPIDIIASGPTVRNRDAPGSALKILAKYKLLDRVSDDVLRLLAEYQIDEMTEHFEKSHTYIIGSNRTALSKGKTFIEETGKTCIVLTNDLEGLVENVADALVQLTRDICRLLNGNILEADFRRQCSEILPTLHVSNKSFDELTKTLLTRPQEVSLLFGGETTVDLKGSGKGGRNMELSLRFSREIAHVEKEVFQGLDVAILSAGTDGIDGPTDAAGAIAYLGQAQLASQSSISIDNYIANNDSYNFFKRFNNGKDLITTGHTGTNVMDVIILNISKIN